MPSGEKNQMLMREEHFIDITGNRMRIEEYGPILQDKVPTEPIKIQIYNSSGTYSIDPKNSKAIFSDISGGRKDIWTEGSLLFVSNLSKGSGSKRLQGSFLGRDCVVIEMPMNKQWIWDGVLLKHEMDAGIKMTLEATEIEENVPLSDQLFSVPENVQIQSLEQSFGESVDAIRKWKTQNHDANSGSQTPSIGSGSSSSNVGSENQAPAQSGNSAPAISVPVSNESESAKIEVMTRFLGHVKDSSISFEQRRKYALLMAGFGRSSIPYVEDGISFFSVRKFDHL